MATLTWDNPGEKIYETGVSKGVFYGEDGAAVAWNGLTSVEEVSGNTVEPVHYDGRKINDIVTHGDFSGIMRAWTYPDEFLPYEGIVEDQSGVFLGNQYVKRFGLCYRTEIGNDVDGIGHGYKIHVLYNVTAIPSSKVYATLGLDNIPHEFEWNISTIPEDVAQHRPTAHLIIDSRTIDAALLVDIESILYGDSTRDGFLPALEGFIAFMRKWDRFIVDVFNDDSFTARTEIPDVITMDSPTEWTIDFETAIITGPDTWTLSSSDKNEEDL